MADPCPTEHTCEIETAPGQLCGRPALYTSMFTWHLVEERFCWVCEDHGRELSETAARVMAEG